VSKKGDLHQEATMKLQLKVGERDQKRKRKKRPAVRPAESKDQVVIDITQVMAASQALLKNLALKINTMDERLLNMEAAGRQLQKLIDASSTQNRLLLEPPKPVESWKPDYPALSEEYFGKFSLFDRLFRPDRMRRSNAES
jgi:hypothetical protein